MVFGLDWAYFLVHIIYLFWLDLDNRYFGVSGRVFWEVFLLFFWTSLFIHYNIKIFSDNICLEVYFHNCGDIGGGSLRFLKSFISFFESCKYMASWFERRMVDSMRIYNSSDVFLVVLFMYMCVDRYNPRDIRGMVFIFIRIFCD